MHKLAVLVSGTGSLLEAILNENLFVELVVADRPCRAIDEVAPRFGVRSLCLPRSNFSKTFNYESYTALLKVELMQYGITVAAMAGFMTILSPALFAVRYKNRILNTHPSLLPAFKGPHAVADALAYGVKVTGCTVHIATARLDWGPILAQEAVCVEEKDTVETLHERIKQVERRLYPATIREFIKTL